MTKNIVTVKQKEEEYSLKIGIIKSLKNIGVTYLIPALLYLINNANEWIPQEHAATIAPLIGFMSYLIKNKIDFK